MTKEITKKFYIEDVDCTFEVIETTRKEVLSYIDMIIDNIRMKEEIAKNGGFDNIDVSDMVGYILYKDGTSEYIDESFDGHKIRRTNIQSAMYEDGWETRTFGEYEVNECGVVYIK